MNSQSAGPVRVWTHIILPALLLVLAVVVLLPLARARAQVRQDQTVTAPDIQVIADTFATQSTEPVGREARGAER